VVPGHKGKILTTEITEDTEEDVRRTTVDGRANPCAVVVRRWSVVGRANAVIPATSGRPESDGAGRFTTKPPRHQGKIHREDGGKSGVRRKT
jgi:hypothetical protein